MKLSKFMLESFYGAKLDLIKESFMCVRRNAINVDGVFRYTGGKIRVDCGNQIIWNIID